MSGLESWEDDLAAQDEHLSPQTQNINIQANERGSTLAPDASPFRPGAQSLDPEQLYGQYGEYQQGFRGQYYNQQHELGGNYTQQGYGQNYQGYGQQQLHNPSFAPQQQQQPPQQQQIPFIAKRPSAADPESTVAASAPKPAPSPGPPLLRTLSISAETPGAVAPKSKGLSIDENVSTASAAGNTSAEDLTTKNATRAIEDPREPLTKKSTDSNKAPSLEPSGPSAESKEANRKADAVAQEQAAHVDEELLDEVYGKEHVNLIFIGHVDAGKSTLGGSILYATGMVDERTMEKYRRESKEAGESFPGPSMSLVGSFRFRNTYESKSADVAIIRSRNMGAFMGIRCAFSSSPLRPLS